MTKLFLKPLVYLLLIASMGLIVCCSGCQSKAANTEKSVKGLQEAELLIQLSDQRTIESLTEEFTNFKMKVVKEIAPSQNIWLVSLQFKGSIDKMLAKIKTSKGVQQAQANQEIYQRNKTN